MALTCLQKEDSSWLRQAGFTLYEIIVVLAIIGILTLIITVAYPSARSTQALRVGEQQFQALLRDALSQALNEERDPDCATLMQSQGKSTRLCSDVGVRLEDDKMILFADIAEPNQNSFEPTSDFILQEIPFTAGVRAEEPVTFVFEAKPPTINLFANGGELVESHIFKILISHNRVESELTVNPYGDVSNE